MSGGFSNVLNEWRFLKRFGEEIDEIVRGYPPLVLRESRVRAGNGHRFGTSGRRLGVEIKVTFSIIINKM